MICDRVLRREFWKEGVKKHVALANVATTCYEKLVSCMATEQQEDIRFVRCVIAHICVDVAIFVLANMIILNTKRIVRDVIVAVH